ncbi:MAG: cadherin-like domain-containing protein, partial [Gammaproteobacteria bacterium]
QFVHNGGETAPAYSVTVSDGSLSDGPEAATITFANQNDAPVLGNNSLTINEGETVVLDSADLSATDVDNIDSTLTFTVSGVSNGRFELVSNAGVAITSFTQAQITAGDVQFVHIGGETAPTYSITVSDGSLSDGPEAATITFNNQNDAPVLGNNSLTIDEGETVILGSSDLSATDVDTDDATLTFSVSGVTSGQFELVSNAGVAITTFTQAQLISGDVQFVHNGGETAPAYSVTVSDGSLSDGSEAAAITFTNINDAPVIGTNSLTLNEGETVVLNGADLSATDIDTADATLTFTVSGVTNGQFELVSNAGVAITSFTQAQITAGDVQFVHNGGEVAPTYSVLVSDGLLSDGPVAATIMFTNVNDAPMIGNNSLMISEGETVILDSLDLSAMDVDSDDSSLIFTISGLTNGQFELVSNTGIAITSFTQAQISAGDVQFVHSGGEAAPTYSVSVNDGTLTTGPEDSLILFSNVNDAPILSIPAGYTFNEDVMGSLGGISLGDDSLGPITMTLSVTTGQLISSGGVGVTSSGSGTTSLTLTGTATDLNDFLGNSNAVRFRSLPNINDDATLTVTVDDGEFTDTESAAITVNAVNDAPVANNDEFFIEAGTTLTIDMAADLLANDSDIDGDTLTITSFTQPGNGTLVDNGDGTLSFTPDVGVESGGVFQYTVSDGNGGFSVATAVIQQQGIWSITGDTTAEEGASANYTLSFTGTDDSSIDVSLTDIDTTSADYADLVAAITAAVSTRSDLSFDGTTLSYTAPETYLSSYDDVNSNFIDISSTGTALNLNDDDFTQQSIGFGFNFYGDMYQQLFVGSNGMLTFAQGSDEFDNTELLLGNELDQLPGIMGFWDNLDPQNSAFGNIYTELTGVPGNQQLIVQYSDLHHFDNPADEGITFQIVLSEGTDTIEIRYLDAEFGNVNDNGASATIGLTDGSSEFVQHSFDTASITSGSSLTFNANDRSMVDLSFTLGIVDDATGESDERFSLDLSNVTDGFISASQNSVTTEIDGSDPATGQPVIIGTPIENQTLAADISGIADEDGLGPFSYQWFRDGVAVNGATGSIYQLDTADIGTNITVEVSFTDGEGNAESITSNLVGPVAAVNDAPVINTNALSIDEGETVILTAADLSATDEETDDSSLTFTVSNVTNGQFELASNSGVAITTFTQAQINAGDVQFVHSGEAPPNYSVEVSDGMLTVGPEAAVITFANVNDAPVIGNNVLNVVEGGTVVLNAMVLSAVDIDSTDSTLLFMINGVSGGQFELVANPGVAISSFTQAQITAGDIQFVHDGGEAAPAYSVTVSDGALTDGPEAATIGFSNVSDAPVLGANTLTIDESETVILTASNLSASDEDTTLGLLQFTVSGVTGGQFELVAVPGFAITTFTQSQLMAGQVQFVHDGENEAPAYLVAVGDGQFVTAPEAATINFGSANDVPELSIDSAPVVFENQTQVTRAQAIDGDGDPLSFSIAGGADASLFSLDSQSGDLNFITAPNFEQPTDADEDGVYELALQVDDGVGGVTQTSVNVRVANVNEAPVATNANVAVDAATVVSWIATLEATDEDATDDLTFSFAGNNPTEAWFRLDAATGELGVNSNIMAEGVYDLEIRVTDANGESSVAAVKVTVFNSQRAVPETPQTPDSNADDTAPPVEAQEPVTDSTDRESTDESAGDGEVDPESNSAREVLLTPTDESLGRTGSVIDRDFIDFDELPVQSDGAFAFTNERFITSRPLYDTSGLGSFTVTIDNLLEKIKIGNVNDISATFGNLSITIPPDLAMALEKMVSEDGGGADEVALEVSGAIAGSVALSAGFIVWLLRAGSLLGSLMASRPLWTSIDPLPIFWAEDEQKSSGPQ